MALAALLSLVPSTAGAAWPHRRQVDVVELNDALGSIRQRQADVAAELDVLVATNDEVTASLEALRANVEEQQRLTDTALATAEEARRAEVKAETLVELRSAEADAISARLAAMAIDLYLRPPLDDAVHAMVTGSLNDAPTAFALARFRSEDVGDLLRAKREALVALDAALAAASSARRNAERAAAAEKVKLGELHDAQTQQQQFAAEVGARIERMLGEAAVLAAQDRDLAEQIAQREIELAQQLRSMLEVRPGTTGSSTTGSSTTGGSTTGGSTTGSGTGGSTTGGSTGGSTTGGGSTGGGTSPGTVVPVETTWVRGIEVATAIAEQLEALLDAAEADGLTLTGYGYRNIYDQIAIRREVCGPTDYDIWLKPSWECYPPAAIPGRSMHEKGLAVDFSGPDGDLVRSSASPTYRWLVDNADAFGFYNLPGEPWHWSTNGS